MGPPEKNNRYYEVLSDEFEKILAFWVKDLKKEKKDRILSKTSKNQNLEVRIWRKT